MDCSFLSLEGKIALITGASRGIGKAIALAFADAGADLAIAARKTADLEKAAEEVRAKGRRCLAVSAHSRKVEELKNLVDKTMEEYRRIDVLVNNAAGNPAMGPIVDTDEKIYDLIMETNLKGYFVLSQLVGRVMVNERCGELTFPAADGATNAVEGAAEQARLRPRIALGIDQLFDADG